MRGSGCEIRLNSFVPQREDGKNHLKQPWTLKANKLLLLVSDREMISFSKDVREAAGIRGVYFWGLTLAAHPHPIHSSDLISLPHLFVPCGTSPQNPGNPQDGRPTTPILIIPLPRSTPTLVSPTVPFSVPGCPRNGGTARGRADGFDLEALPKLAKLRGRGPASRRELELELGGHGFMWLLAEAVGVAMV